MRSARSSLMLKSILLSSLVRHSLCSMPSSRKSRQEGHKVRVDFSLLHLCCSRVFAYHAEWNSAEALVQEPAVEHNSRSLLCYVNGCADREGSNGKLEAVKLIG